PSAWIRSSSSGIRLAPSRREYSLCVWRWTNAIRLAEDIGARVHCQNRAAPDILRPMRGLASLFALGLMMALFHRVTAGAALEARATLALGFLLLAAFVGGDLAARARLPRITGDLLVGLAVGPWLGLVRRDEVDALRFIGDVTLGLIALAAGAELALPSLRDQLVALARLVGGAIAFPLLVVATVLLSVSPWFPLTAHQSPGDAVAVALALGALSAVSSPAVAMGMLSELGGRGRGRATGAARDHLGCARRRALPRDLLARRRRAGASRAETRGASRLHLILRPGGCRPAPERIGRAVAMGAVAGRAAGHEPA